jgi:hypothetical protein
MTAEQNGLPQKSVSVALNSAFTISASVGVMTNNVRPHGKSSVKVLQLCLQGFAGGRAHGGRRSRIDKLACAYSITLGSWFKRLA